MHRNLLGLFRRDAGYRIKRLMRKAGLPIPDLLKQLGSFYGEQEPCWPTDPYLFLVWWHCGYPASDAACAKGWESLRREIGVEPQQLLAARPLNLATALKPGGMVPELRALRLKEIAARVQDEFGGDLGAALVGPIAQVRKALKKFPSIGDPGADRILLFAGIAPVAAVPSNCPHVVVRVQRGPESANYVATYREARQAIETEVPEKLDARIRAYLLLKRHGQELCKLAKPKCAQCPVRSSCVFFADRRGVGN
jgi:endonuclease-3